MTANKETAVSATIKSSNIKIEEVKIEPLYREYRVSMPANSVIEDSEKELQEKAANFEMAGFRKGNVPMKIVRKHMGTDILSRYVDKAVAKMLQKIIIDNSLTISAPPGIEIEEFEQDAELRCFVKFELLAPIPEFDYNDTRLAVDILELNITEQDLDRARGVVMRTDRKFAEAPKDYKALVGDQVIVDYEGRIAGQPFEGNTASGMEIIIGDGQMVDGFEAQMVGTQIGETKAIQVRFPDDYPSEEIATKEAVFKVVIKNIMRLESGEIDEVMLKEVGFESVDDFNQMLKERIIADFAVISRLRTKKILFDNIDKVVDMEVPPKMIEVDFKSLWSEVLPKLPLGTKPSADDQTAKKIMNMARRRVKMGLILADVAKRHEIEVSAEDVEMTRTIEKAKRPEEEAEIDAFYKKNMNIEKIKGAILEEKVVDLLLEKVPVTIISVTSGEFNDKYAAELQDII